jgi:hypothetical protein
MIFELPVNPNRLLTRLLLGFTLAIVLVVSGCGYSLESSLSPAVAQVKSMEPHLALERGLGFVEQVKVVVDTPEQAQKAMADQITRDHTDEELRIGGESGAMTGLYPSNIDLRRKTLELLRDQVIAFYDPDTRQMVIVEGRSGLAAENRTGADGTDQLVIAHELTHALQDQHFGIRRMLERVKHNDDETLALKCVAEGDATLAALSVTSGGLRRATLESTLKRLAALSTDPPVEQGKIPLAVVMPMLFEYSAGLHFVAQAWQHGGWKAVDKLYRHPPLSTQQIMQPDLYFDHPTPPLQIDLSGYHALLTGWNKVDDDTYGELLLKLLLQRNLPPHARALNVVSHWAGDRIITLQKGHQLTLIWLIAFRNQGAAQEFATTYSQILDHLGNISNPHGVAVHSAAVFVAIGPGVGYFPQLSNAVWKASKIGSATPP